MVTAAEYEQIKEHRTVFFNTPAGRRLLTGMLYDMGFFRSSVDLREQIKDDPGVVTLLLAAFGLLEELGIWHAENFELIVDKMAELPMPSIVNRKESQ